jgi:hypothetical protein
MSEFKDSGSYHFPDVVWMIDQCAETNISEMLNTLKCKESIPTITLKASRSNITQ